MSTDESRDQTTERSKEQHQQQTNNVEPTDDVTTCTYMHYHTLLNFIVQNKSQSYEPEVHRESNNQHQQINDDDEMLNTAVKEFWQETQLMLK